MTTEENELSVVNSVYLQYKGSEGAPDNSYHISSFLVTLQTENFRGKVEFEITSNHIDIVSEQLDLFCKSFFSISNDLHTKIVQPPEIKCGYGDDISFFLKFHKSRENGGVQIECLIQDDFTPKSLNLSRNCNSLFVLITAELQQVKEFSLFLKEIYKSRNPLNFELRGQ